MHFYFKLMDHSTNYTKLARRMRTNAFLENISMSSYVFVLRTLFPISFKYTVGIQSPSAVERTKFNVIQSNRLEYTPSRNDRDEAAANPVAFLAERRHDVIYTGVCVHVQA